MSGLNICTNFLDPKEVEALRTLVGSHRAWAQYTYGSTGRHGELASMVQRIDFGPANLPPEGERCNTPPPTTTANLRAYSWRDAMLLRARCLPI